MLIPMRSGRLLLPSTAVAEVIGYRTPDHRDDQPGWLQGTVSWHQRDIPVLDFERLIGRAELSAGIRQRIAVCYAIGGRATWPLIGLVAQGIPRLMRVSQQSIQVASGEQAGAKPIRMTLSIAGENLIVPDLEFLQGQLAAA
ncbi:MAG: chemotaxis protein CheW [Gammaproteobacteria bacterium]|nr:chemotaxis protein CheW [Gammaproteobacteria bacterium]